MPSHQPFDGATRENDKHGRLSTAILQWKPRRYRKQTRINTRSHSSDRPHGTIYLLLLVDVGPVCTRNERGHRTKIYRQINVTFHEHVHRNADEMGNGSHHSGRCARNEPVAPAAVVSIKVVRHEHAGTAAEKSCEHRNGIYVSDGLPFCPIQTFHSR